MTDSAGSLLFPMVTKRKRLKLPRPVIAWNVWNADSSGWKNFSKSSLMTTMATHELIEYDT